MGEKKVVKGRAGAAGAPLTRRQQKRARRRQAMAQRQANAQRLQRPTLPPPPPQTAAPPPQTAAPAPRARAKQAAPPRDVAVTQPELSAVPKPPKAKRTPSVPEMAAPPSGTERKPRRATTARGTRLVAAKAAAKKERKTSTPAGEAPAQASAPSRKYPTLARMAGLRIRPPKPEPVAPATNSAAPHQPRGEPSPPVRMLDTPPALPAEAGGMTPPAAMVRRPSVPTRRLAPSQRVASAAADRSGQHTPFPTPEPANAASSAEWRWGQPETAVIAPLAVVHAALAVLSSLAGMALLLQNMPGAVWLLSLAGICGAGGWLAFALAQQDERDALAGAALLLSQLGVLAWLLALFGPRAAILALLPALTLLALRTTWHKMATAGVIVALALYLADSALTLAGRLQPGLSADQGLLALVDGGFLTLGLGLMLLALLNLHARQARAEALLRSRLYEARQTRTRARQLRQQVEDDADLLEHALVRALRGRGIDPIRAGSALGPLAEHIEVVAERLATLQQDREDRIRLEGATRSLTRAMERAWLGLPWVWPQASGTALDALIALLRAPRPTEPTAASWPDETPTLVPVPTMDSSPWDIVTPRPGSAAGGSGGSWPIPALDPAADGKRPRVFAAPPNTALPWDEWDAWRSWRSEDER